ncbi:MAG: C40 family peptidase [Catalinimonas sp.]
MKKWFWPLVWAGVMVSTGWLAMSPDEPAIRPATDKVQPVAAVETLPPPADDTLQRLMEYARELLGTPYHYASHDPAVGFDCSGFVYHVYSTFGHDLPRSSRTMITAGERVPRVDARPGDLVFFRGTDPSSDAVGHVGIVTAGPTEHSTLRFIHASSSRRQPEVKIDSLASEHYRRRFLSVRRIRSLS